MLSLLLRNELRLIFSYVKYWFVHIILVGALIAVWAPTFVYPVEEPIAIEGYSPVTKHVPTMECWIDTNDNTEETICAPIDDENESTDTESKKIPVRAWYLVLKSIVKELSSTIIVFGNIVTFYWQWQDRRKKKIKS